MLGLTDYFWRLLPGNPILRRVVETGGKRYWHLLIRLAYLGLLVVIAILTLLTSSTGQGAVSLSELAKDSASLFATMSYVQLGLVALLAPVFTAGAITQERDSQTYDILLSTPLSNGQIVLGSLMSRLFFVFALLLSGVPIYSATQIFGGVAIGNIVYSFLIAAATALVTGAMAMAIATLKVGTRRTIFGFYLFIIVYLVGFYLLDEVSFFQVAGRYPNSHISWFTGIHPFLALRVILNQRAYTPPDVAALPAGLQIWPLRWYFTSPQSFYVLAMTGLSLMLIFPSIVLLRRLAQSTTSLRRLILNRLNWGTGDRRRKPRAVWNNPIAWREARTKASAARSLVIRYGFILAGIAAAAVLVGLHSTSVQPRQYISPGAYDAANHMLFVQSNDPDLRSNNHVSPQVAVSLNGEQVKADEAQRMLGGRYAVHDFTTAPVASAPANAQGIVPQQISAIDLEDYPRLLSANAARQWLLGLIVLEFAGILLIVTNAAASTVTREKEDGTLDLLLSTPITSRYYIWGKLRGLVAFVLPLVAVPVLSAGLFVVHDVCRWLLDRGTDFQWIVLPEAIVLMPAMLIIVAAFAAILGMQMSLRFRTTVWAVMSSILIMAGACTALGFCGMELLTSGSVRTFNPIMLGMSTFSPFTLIALQINPYAWAQSAFDANVASDADPQTARLIIGAVATIAVALYGLAVWSMYASMVKNFDMTIRRQSR